MCHWIMPEAWRDAIREFNREHLETRADSRRVAINIFIFALICAGFYCGVWLLGGK